MNIAVIARTLKGIPNDGISRFTFEVVKRLTQYYPSHNFVLVFDKTPDKNLIFPENTKSVLLSPATRHPLHWYFWHEFRLPRLLRNLHADLLLSPDGIIPLRSDIPAISVIHDINFYHRPKDVPVHLRLYYRHFFMKFARKARRIVTVSRFCKDDIASFLQVNPGKIDVAYNGVSEYFTPAEKSVSDNFRMTLTGGVPYFLFVSNFSPRKNIPGVIKAYNKFRLMTGRRVKLVLTGGRLFLNRETDNHIKSSPWRDDILLPGPFKHEDLQSLYSSALALVFVPWFEGFGIPAAEAMRCGTPVILSNTTSLPEIGGDGALFADPGNIDEICDAMIRISEDPVLRTSLSARGIRQSEKFTWDNTAKAVWDSICKAAKPEAGA